MMEIEIIIAVRVVVDFTCNVSLAKPQLSSFRRLAGDQLNILARQRSVLVCFAYKTLLGRTEMRKHDKKV